MSKQSKDEGSNRSTLSAGASPVRMSRAQARGRALLALARDSGISSPGFWASVDRSGPLLRTSRRGRADGSTPCDRTWNGSDMKRFRSRCQREMLARLTGEPAYSSLPTPSATRGGSDRGGAAGRVGPVRHSLDSLARLGMLPTPTTTGNMLSPSMAKWRGHRNLAKLLPTPTVHLLKETGAPSEHRRGERPKGGATLTATLGARGQLSPLFVEWMMGFPIGHTDSGH